MIPASMQEYHVNTYREEFAKAERAIRFAELSINSLALNAPESDECCDRPTETPKGVVIPAVNELRYSAKHFADYIADSCPEHFQRAIRHCVRARFDALRATILFLVRDFRQFSEDYRMLTLDIEGIDAHRNTIESILDFLCEERHGDTDEECTRLQEAIDKLRPFFIHSSSQRGRLNLLLAEMQTRSEMTIAEIQAKHDATIAELRKGTKVAWITGAIFAVVGAVLGFILGKYY